MKPIILVGILLVVLGTLALAYQGINYTREEKVFDSRTHSCHGRDSRANSPSSSTRRTSVGWRGCFAGLWREAKIIARNHCMGICLRERCNTTGRQMESLIIETFQNHFKFEGGRNGQEKSSGSL